MKSSQSSDSDSSPVFSSTSITDEFDLEERSWMEWFLSLKAHDILVEIDEEYALDKFNLTGLMLDDPTYFQDALALITDTLEEHEKLRQGFEREKHRHNRVITTALQMYGLIHARYILTPAGMKKMLTKFQRGVFGKCPRTLCQNQVMLPCGLYDTPRSGGLKFFCPSCEELYEPINRRYQVIDGAYFGSTFPHLFLLTYREHVTKNPKEVYIPKIFGFKLHPSASFHLVNSS
jgi:casein kinase II subunit beta